LIGLSLSSGILSPSFSGSVLAYSARVGIGAQTISLTPTAVAGVSITIEGDAVASGAIWQSGVLGFGANPIVIVVRRNGHPSRSYTLTVTRGYQQGYLKASNTGAGDYFGQQLAIDGDTLVVGTINEDSNATTVNGNQADNSEADSGAVYVFVRTGDVWAQQAHLKASNAAAGDYFGSSLSISGNTIVVGARGEDSNATIINGDPSNNGAANSGAAYVFVRSGVAWTQQAYLKASNAQGGDSFGDSVGISGDTVIVGARLEGSNATAINGNQTDNSASAAGAAYVFVRSGTTWAQQAYLKASNAESADFFGGTAAISGNTAIVGAPGEDSNATGFNGTQTNNSASSSGAVYVFVRSGVVWSQQGYLKADIVAMNDSLGGSLSISGETLVSGAANVEKALVFVRSGVSWSQQATLTASNATSGDAFGYDVAIFGDRIVVGAISEDSSATGINGDQADNSVSMSGAAYAFLRTGSLWTQQAYLKARNTGGDTFGRTVAISGDTMVIGAIFEDSNATGVNGNQSNNSLADSGAVYVIR
jgi:hypothetical protein